MPSVLERILVSTRSRIERRKRELPLARLAAGLQTLSQPRFTERLTQPGLGVVAEFKRRSPSAGELHDAPNLELILGSYERGGALAASILTEEDNFDGSLDDLRAARRACGLPLLRKDFTVDAYQLYEAKLAGADAVLLIVAALEQQTLRGLYEGALELQLDVLVEVHDRGELERALELEPRLIGINNRDLRDFTVDVRRTFELLDAIPSGVGVVSESGIASHDQLHELERAGVQAVLVGETLMRASDPEVALRRLLAGSNG